ncbi:Rieske (2Fe-2S) protein [Novosphingobium aquimarinum]|uniref:Rieske (2Fe-2S) protein n=1 Tax=Novosphingobium aquimarinum TaxID=2682494 RepID=UPI0012EC2278|nr:Rieske (2Fe-2S) protein [Novosphingobium aquimarinum]
MTVREGWHPIAASDDLPAGHIYAAQLCDVPLAVWRGQDGTVNVWEDRCPHRGVRFTIGSIHGDELRCQYHAWRFRSGSGACSAIPAHPTRKPSSAIRATLFPGVERDGLVWTKLAGDQDAPPQLDYAGAVLRAIAVNCTAQAIEIAIARAPLPGVRLFVQPVSFARAVIRGLAEDVSRLAEHDAALERLRRGLERAAA